MQFPVAIHICKEARATDHGAAGVHVTVPALPGCHSQGDSIEAALVATRGAINVHLNSLIDAGGDLPELAPIEDLMQAPQHVGTIWAVVEVDISRFEGRAEKINITVPRRLLAQIDQHAKASNMTRSGYLVAAARVAMQRR